MDIGSLACREVAWRAMATVETDALQDALAGIVGATHVLVADDVRAPFETDWTRRYRGDARLVVRPGDTAQVAAVLQACAAAGAAVVPQGGNTGLVGASVPRGGEVVLSLTRLDAVGEVDPATAQIEVGAGATLAQLQQAARAGGMEAGLDYAARDSCTVGGMVATNAGGMHALRHGTTRARVAGLEAVLADGTVVDRRSGLLKDNAGFDLPALLIGSEGTLGIVTRVRWRLVPALHERVTALVPLASVAGVEGLLAALRPRVGSLEAMEFLLDDGLQLVMDHLDLPSPVPERAPAYVLIECAGREDPTEELADGLEAAGIEDAVIADSATDRERLWRFRESHTEAISAAGVPHKMDVGIPLHRLGAFVEAVPAAVEAVAPGARTILFGHLGDGNVHVNVLGADPEDPAVDEAVLRLAADAGGTISAEHGVGVLKARYLGLVRSEGEIEAMRRVKDALDPGGMLNPGAVLPPRTAG